MYHTPSLETNNKLSSLEEMFNPDRFNDTHAPEG